MPGIRLHHPTFRAAEGTTLTYVVELPLEYKVTKPGGRIRSLEPCATCGKAHQRKAIHLRLDGNGDVIVAPAIYEALQTAFMGGMELVNEVSDPPPLVIGAVHKDKERIVELPLSSLPAADLITPESTRYQNRDRMFAPFQPMVEAILDDRDRKATKKLREKRRLFVSTRKDK